MPKTPRTDEVRSDTRGARRVLLLIAEMLERIAIALEADDE